MTNSPKSEQKLSAYRHHRKHPLDPYGVCYKTTSRRVIGVRSRSDGIWFIGYLDDMEKVEKPHRSCYAQGRDPQQVQECLDEYAKSHGWTVIRND